MFRNKKKTNVLLVLVRSSDDGSRPGTPGELPQESEAAAPSVPGAVDDILDEHPPTPVPQPEMPPQEDIIQVNDLHTHT